MHLPLRTSRILAAALLGPLVSAGSAQALTLDFGVYAGAVKASPLALPNATLTSSGPEFATIPAGFATSALDSRGGFCARIATGSSNCSAETSIDFLFPVEALTFLNVSYHTGDVAVATLYAGATELHSADIGFNGVVDFSAFTGITRLVLDTTGSAGGGVIFGNFAFEAAPTPPPASDVPLPASAPLLAGALGLVALVRRVRGRARA